MGIPIKFSPSPWTGEAEMCSLPSKIRACAEVAGPTDRLKLLRPTTLSSPVNSLFCLNNKLPLAPPTPTSAEALVGVADPSLSSPTNTSSKMAVSLKNGNILTQLTTVQLVNARFPKRQPRLPSSLVTRESPPTTKPPSSTPSSTLVPSLSTSTPPTGTNTKVVSTTVATTPKTSLSTTWSKKSGMVLTLD